MTPALFSAQEGQCSHNEQLFGTLFSTIVQYMDLGFSYYSVSSKLAVMRKLIISSWAFSEVLVIIVSEHFTNINECIFIISLEKSVEY